MPVMMSMMDSAARFSVTGRTAEAAELVVRLRVAGSWHHRGDELGAQGRPQVGTVTEVVPLVCPAGYRFGQRDFTATRIAGHSDGWSYTGRAETTFTPRDESTGDLSMAVTLDSLTWTGLRNVEHPILGVFAFSYTDDITLRCPPRR